MALGFPNPPQYAHRRARKEANRIYYRIRNHPLLDLIGIMRDVLCPANLDDRYPR